MPKDSVFFTYLRNSRNLWNKLREALTREKKKNEAIVSLEDVGKVFQMLLNNFYQHEYTKYPINDLKEENYIRILSQTVLNYNIHFL